MSRKKIAFVVVRYGMEINGGAEFHCRMLAERLANLLPAMLPSLQMAVQLYETAIAEGITILQII